MFMKRQLVDRAGQTIVPNDCLYINHQMSGGENPEEASNNVRLGWLLSLNERI
jgi:hypothetical protein